MENGQIILVVIGLLVSVSSIGGFIATLVFNARRRPPLPEEVAKTYVRKDEFKSEITRLERQIEGKVNEFTASQRGIVEKIDQLRNTVQSQARETDRALGRIEGALGTKKG